MTYDVFKIFMAEQHPHRFTIRPSKESASPATVMADLMDYTPMPTWNTETYKQDLEKLSTFLRKKPTDVCINPHYVAYVSLYGRNIKL